MSLLQAPLIGQALIRTPEALPHGRADTFSNLPPDAKRFTFATELLQAWLKKHHNTMPFLHLLKTQTVDQHCVNCLPTNPGL